MSLQIVLHTLKMIFRNLGQALRVSVGPYLILIVLSLLVFMVFGGAGSQLTSGNAGAALGSGLATLLLVPLFLFVTSWVAVSWHRFILKEEYTGLLPEVSGRPIWPYAWKAILLALIVMVVAIPLFFILGTLSLPFVGANGGGGFPIIATLTFMIVFVLISVVSMRLGIALVGTALGEPMPFRDAWAATAPVNGTIVGVAVILGIFNAVISLLLIPLTYAIPLIATVVSLGFNWLTMMVGISILTTLYGHVIQERPLLD